MCKQGLGKGDGFPFSKRVVHGERGYGRGDWEKMGDCDGMKSEYTNEWKRKKGVSLNSLTEIF